MKSLTKIYIGLTFLLIGDLVLYLTSEISFAGRLADQFLLWLWFILTLVVIFGQLKKKWTKVYGLILFILTILSFFPMGVPFLTIVGLMIQEPNPDYLYKDNDIRVELTSKSVIGKQYIAVINNYLIFEREIGEISPNFKVGEYYYYYNDIQSVYRLDSPKNNRIVLNFDFGNDTVKKEIKN